MSELNLDEVRWRRGPFRPPKRKLRTRIAVWRRRLRHQRAIVHDARGRDLPERSVMILGSGRSGTTLLLDYLRSINGVDLTREILNHQSAVGVPVRLPTAVVRGHVQRSLRALDGDLVGAKVLFDQLGRRGLPIDVFDEWLPGCRYLVSYRRSIGDQFVSHLLAHRANAFSGRSERITSDAPIRVDPDHFLEFAGRIRQLYQEALSIPSIATSPWVSYEDLAADAASVFRDQVLPHLDLPRNESIHTDLVRQNSLPIEERVANWVEVRHLLQADSAVLDPATLAR